MIKLCPNCHQPLPELRAGILDCSASIVHGWRDDVVPFEHSVRFAQTYKAALHLLESDHRLHNQLRVIQYLFEYFLIALDLPAIAQNVRQIVREIKLQLYELRDR
jgi:predicted amidophosphoribosyltransferase